MSRDPNGLRERIEAFIARVEGYQVGDFDVTLPSVGECEALLTALSSPPDPALSEERLAEVLRRLGWQQPGPGTTNGQYRDPEAAFLANVRDVLRELSL